MKFRRRERRNNGGAIAPTPSREKLPPGPSSPLPEFNRFSVVAPNSFENSRIIVDVPLNNRGKLILKNDSGPINRSDI